MSDSGFDLNNFRAEVMSRGIHKTNLFRVLVFPPQAVQTSDPRIITMFCDATNLPGVALAVVEAHQRYGYGQVEMIPFQPIFEDFVSTFMLENADEIRTFFIDWMNSIVSFDFTGDDTAYEVSYKSDYAGQMVIEGLDDQQNTIYSYQIRDVFPIAVGAVQMNWNDQNQQARLSVTFSYKDWKNN